MSFSFALASVLVSLAVSLLAGVMLLAFVERWLNISLWMVRISAKFVPVDEREDQIDEWLGDLSHCEQTGPMSVVWRSLGLLVAGPRIGLSARLEFKVDPNPQMVVSPPISPVVEFVNRFILSMNSASPGALEIIRLLSGSDPDLGGGAHLSSEQFRWLMDEGNSVTKRALSELRSSSWVVQRKSRSGEEVYYLPVPPLLVKVALNLLSDKSDPGTKEVCADFVSVGYPLRAT